MKLSTICKQFFFFFQEKLSTWLSQSTMHQYFPCHYSIILIWLPGVVRRKVNFSSLSLGTLTASLRCFLHLMFNSLKVCFERLFCCLVSWISKTKLTWVVIVWFPFPKLEIIHVTLLSFESVRQEDFKLFGQTLNLNQQPLLTLSRTERREVESPSKKTQRR